LITISEAYEQKGRQAKYEKKSGPDIVREVVAEVLSKKVEDL